MDNATALLGLHTLPELEQSVGRLNLTPGWIPRTKPLLWSKMLSEFVPAHWRWNDARVALNAAARVISTELAERRNLIMRNPVLDNDFATLRTMVCAYQTILPGEKARSHRHVSHAMRVILESRGSYSIVNGEKHPMETGDIVLTPGGSWHGHGHEGSDQAYWWDGLDVPLTHLLEPMFFEEHPKGWEDVSRQTEVSPMRFRMADMLAQLRVAPPDLTDHFGTSITLPAPTMPTLTLKVSRWPTGWKSRPYRRTANTVYVVMRGSGRSRIGEGTFDWQFGDTFVIPGWTRTAHQASEDSLLFSMSDEELMRWTKYYRIEDVD